MCKTCGSCTQWSKWNEGGGWRVNRLEGVGATFNNTQKIKFLTLQNVKCWWWVF